MAQALATFLLQVADPRGRCNRQGLLIVAGLLLGLEAVAAGAVWLTGAAIDGGLAVTLKLVFVWFAFSAGAKRLHDLDLSAWWMAGMIGITTVWSVVVVLGLVMTVGAVVLQPTSRWYLAAVMATSLPVFAGTLWLHFARGATADNRFGAVPTGLGLSPLAVPAAMSTAAA
jgi:uncharacterized membrane protein YhaH (DUF805 family)